MAWNPSPQVAAARDFGKMFDKEVVIVFHANAAGQFGYASYGRTKALCGEAKKMADMMYNAAIEGRA